MVMIESCQNGEKRMGMAKEPAARKPVDVKAGVCHPKADEEEAPDNKKVL